MKLDTRTEQVERSLIKSTTDFTVKADAHLFKLLIRQYQNPIYALLREIGCNCMDSLAEAKKKESFTIYLPNMMNPQIRLVDNGTGLSRQDIEEMYSVAGLSTKNNSNKYTGCWGIGKLACLAYTPAFNVISRHNGEKHTYICAISETGIPQLNYLGTQKTQEQNGLEISCAVKSHDISTFTNEVKNVFKYFKPRPEIKGGSIYWDNVDYLYDEKLFAIDKVQNNPVAVMGFIAYPIKLDVLYTDYYERQNLTNCGLELRFNIGDLNITPSRDSLEYTPDTIQKLKDRITVVKDFLTDKVKDEFKNCKNLYEARIHYGKIVDKISKLVDTKNLTWKNHHIGNQIEWGTKNNIYPYEYYGILRFSRGRSQPASQETSCSINTLAHHKTLFCFKDIDKTSHSRCFHALDNNKADYIYLLEDKDAQDVFVKAMGFDDSYIANVSTLDEPPKVVRAKRRTSTFFDQLAPGNNYWATPNIQLSPNPGLEVKDIKKGTYIYVHLFRYDEKCSKSDKKISVGEIRSNLTNLGVKVPVIVGVRVDKIEKVKTLKNWVPLTEWATQELEKYIKNNAIDDILGAQETLAKLKHNDVSIFDLVEKSCAGLTGDLPKFVTEIKDIKKKLGTKDITSVRNLAAQLNFTLPSNKFERLVKEEENLCKKYPVLDIASYMGYINKDAFIKTLKFMVEKS